MESYVVLDLETTGLPSTSKIIEIGAWKIINGVHTGKFNMLVNPRCHIPREASLVNHITDEMVANELGIEEVLPQFYDFCEDLPFLAHNIAYDYGILIRRGKEVGLDFSLNGERLGLCTLKLSKQLYPNCSHKLGDLVEVFNLGVEVTSERTLHSALYDAYMCKRLLERMSMSGAHLDLPMFTPKRLGGI